MASPLPLREGLPPVIDGKSRAIILGTFPSEKSLATRQYYANPQNAFWRITGALFGFGESAPYESRLRTLQSHGLALWDVLHRCRLCGVTWPVRYHRLPSTSSARAMAVADKLAAWQVIGAS